MTEKQRLIDAIADWARNSRDIRDVRDGLRHALTVATETLSKPEAFLAAMLRALEDDDAA